MVQGILLKGNVFKNGRYWLVVTGNELLKVRAGCPGVGERGGDLLQCAFGCSY